MLRNPVVNEVSEVEANADVSVDDEVEESPSDDAPEPELLPDPVTNGESAAQEKPSGPSAEDTADSSPSDSRG